MRALALLLCVALAAPALAGDDAPRRAELLPASAPAAEPAFDAAQHPIIATAAITGGVLTALLVVALVVSVSGANRYPVDGSCPGCRF